MMCLRPMNFPHAYYFERRDDLGQGNLHEMVDDMSDVVLTCLRAVLDKWEELAEYFDEVLCEKRALFHPAFHDTLLTDDVALSRSKKYFWAIEFLKEMEKSVQDNIRQLDRLSQLLRANPPPVGRPSRDFEARLRKQEGALAKLEALRVRFTQKRGGGRATGWAVQRERRHGEPHVDEAGREHQTADVCQHIFPSPFILHSECLSVCPVAMRWERC